jgi:hypothetical protein
VPAPSSSTKTNSGNSAQATSTRRCVIGGLGSG